MGDSRAVVVGECDRYGGLVGVKKKETRPKPLIRDRCPNSFFSTAATGQEGELNSGLWMCRPVG